MSDRANSLASIAASGCGSPFGIHGDLGSFSGPYPDPSPPGGVFGISDYDMSDDYYPSSGEDYFDADNSTSKAPAKDDSSRSAPKKKKKPTANAKEESKVKKSSTKRKKPNSPMTHRHLDQDPTKITPLSEDLRENLARATLTPAAYTYYVHIIGVDKEMQRQLSHLEREEDSVNEAAVKEESIDEVDVKEEPVDEVAVKEEPVETSGDGASDFEIDHEPAEAGKKVKSGRAKRKLNRKKVEELTQMMIKKKYESREARVSFQNWALTQLDIRWHRRFQKLMHKHDFLASDSRLEDMKTEAGRKKQRVELLSRPLSEVPFNTAERRSSTKIVEEMRSEEHLLNALRKLIEKNWPYKPQGCAKHIPIKDLIKKVRKIEENILGISLLPSTDCVYRIIMIVNATYRIETRSPGDEHCAIPTDLAEEFEQSLYMKDVYDTWRATNPPDLERLKDFMMRGCI
ncbi:hypothetical protein KCU77_g3572, partial [Aureobasidium melanogenum]